MTHLRWCRQAASSALVLVVHGAGESFWRRRPGARRGLCESVGHLRNNAAKAAAQRHQAERQRVSQIERQRSETAADGLGDLGAGRPQGGAASGEGGAEAAASTAEAAARAAAKRVEFLGVEWSHSIRGSYAREGEKCKECKEGGANSLNPTKRLSSVTLRSVPMLREFANEVILDVLFYEQARNRGWRGK